VKILLESSSAHTKNFAFLSRLAKILLENRDERKVKIYVLWLMVHSKFLHAVSLIFSKSYACARVFLPARR
jgi:hypothetical protein